MMLRNTLAIALLVPVLAGCFGAVAVGAGAGALVLADRRVSETYLADEAIEIRAVNRINERLGDKIHVNATSYNRMLLLTGEATTQAVKDEAEKLVRDVPNVKAITNELVIGGITSFGSRSNDVYITSKVKARFVDFNRFAANHVKVVTEGGTVYLLGMVTQAEADAAVEIARTTGGVLKVVRVFEIIRPEDAKRIDNPNPAPASAKPKA